MGGLSLELWQCGKFSRSRILGPNFVCVLPHFSSNSPPAGFSFCHFFLPTGSGLPGGIVSLLLVSAITTYLHCFLYCNVHVLMATESQTHWCFRLPHWVSPARYWLSSGDVRCKQRTWVAGDPALSLTAVSLHAHWPGREHGIFALAYPNFKGQNNLQKLVRHSSKGHRMTGEGWKIPRVALTHFLWICPLRLSRTWRLIYIMDFPYINVPQTNSKYRISLYWLCK